MPFHALAVALVLVVAALATRPGVPFFSDEGAVVVQAEQLSRTGRWTYRNPVPDIDPDGSAMPFPQGDQGDKGRAPYARHPIYPLLLWGARTLAGELGLILLSIAGTTGAALVGGILAGRVAAGLVRPVLWLTALGTPLLFDSLVVVAHTLGAAGCGLAVLALLKAMDDDAPRRLAWFGALTLSVAAATALRSEAVFVGPGLALGAVAAAVAGAPRRLAGVAALVALGAAGLTRLAEQAFLQATVGAETQVALARGGYWSGRGRGFVTTWLDPSDSDGPEVMVLAYALLLLVGGTLLVRQRSLRLVGVVALAFAAAAYVARLFVAPVGLVPGLLMAFPAGVVGVCLISRRDLRSRDALVCAVTAATVALCVLLTQYPEGGSVEFGGRYFAIILPIAVVPLAVAWRRVLTQPGVARIAVAGASAVAASVMVVTALGVVRATHGRTEAFLADLREARAVTGDPRPLVVTTQTLLPQLAWPDFHQYRWLIPTDAEFPEVMARAAAAGTDRIVIAVPELDRQLERAAPHYTLVGERPLGWAAPVPVAVLEANVRS